MELKLERKPQNNSVSLPEDALQEVMKYLDPQSLHMFGLSAKKQQNTTKLRFEQTEPFRSFLTLETKRALQNTILSHYFGAFEPRLKESEYNSLQNENMQLFAQSIREQLALQSDAWLPQNKISLLLHTYPEYQYVWGGMQLFSFFSSTPNRRNHLVQAKAIITQKLCEDFLNLYNDAHINSPYKQGIFFTLMNAAGCPEHPLMQLLSYALQIHNEFHQKGITDGWLGFTKKEKYDAAFAFLNAIKIILSSVLKDGFDDGFTYKIFLRSLTIEYKLANKTLDAETLPPVYQDGRLKRIYEENVLCLKPLLHINKYGQEIDEHGRESRHPLTLLLENMAASSLSQQALAKQIAQLIAKLAQDFSAKADPKADLAGRPKHRLFSFEERKLLKHLLAMQGIQKNKSFDAAIKLVVLVDTLAEAVQNYSSNLFASSPEKAFNQARDYLISYYGFLQKKHDAKKHGFGIPAFDINEDTLTPELHAIHKELGRSSVPSGSSSSCAPK